MRNQVKSAIKKISPRFFEWLKFQRTKRLIMRGDVGVVPEKALEAKYKESLAWLTRKDAPHALGVYLEFGVYFGMSLACMSRALQSLDIRGMRLFGFDSFEGMPEAAGREDDGVWAPGEFTSHVGLTHKYLKKANVDTEQIILIKGWFDETLTPELIRHHEIKSASIIMIDCDIYSSAKTALTFCTPLIRDEAVILFDDWNSGGLADKGLGEKKAFDEWLSENPCMRYTEFQNYSSNSKVVKVFRQH